MFKNFLFMLCILCLISVVFNGLDAGTDHEEADPLHHDDLSVTTNFRGLWNQLGVGPRKIVWYAATRADAPSNANGEYEVYAWVDGGDPDRKAKGYTGGTTVGAFSSVVKHICEPTPKHNKGGIIDGSFNVGGIVHTADPQDHVATDDR